MAAAPSSVSLRKLWSDQRRLERRDSPVYRWTLRGSPVVVGVLAAWRGWSTDTGALLTAMALVTGLLLSLYVVLLELVFALRDRVDVEGRADRLFRRAKALRDLGTQAAYSFALSFAATVSLLFGPWHGWQGRVLQGIQVVLLAHFALTFVAVFRRSYMIMGRSLEQALAEPRDPDSRRAA